MSGTGHTSVTVNASGDARVDGLLSSFGWGDATIYYSMPTSGSVYGSGYGGGEQNGFIAATAAMETAIHSILNADDGNVANDAFSLEGITALDVQNGGEPNSHIRVAQTSLDPYAVQNAYAYLPAGTDTSGDAWFTNVLNDYTNPQIGGFSYFATMQTLGYALGLQAAHLTAAYGAVPSAYDSMEYTVMSARSYVGDALDGYQNQADSFAQSWMMLDIAAFQHMYGADFSTNSGNTVYSWAPGSGDTTIDGVVAISPTGNRIFATTWDGGGIDTYDLSAYSTRVVVDLAPGAASVFSSAQLADLEDGQSASGNIYNSLLYQNDARSLIENATGGSGHDALRGNQADNTLIGNGGDDLLVGRSGNDTLQGGSGRDTLNGGLGNDTMDGGDDNDVLTGGAGHDTMIGGSGDDRLNGRAGQDDMQGGLGNDIMYGVGGKDEMFGNDGDDTIRGGNGADVIEGGAGCDTMFGNAGADTFRFVSVSDSATGTKSDQIMDFAVGADQIDLSALSGTPFTVSLVTGAFSGSGPSAITREVAADTLVFVDVDGDATADMRIVVSGTLGLTADDFVL